MNTENKLKLYISNTLIRERVKNVAREISHDYKGKTPLLIGILNGAFVFLADLMRELKIDVEIDFLKLSSYGNNKFSSGNIRLLKSVGSPLKGKDVIVVEDIIDSGLSIEYVYKMLVDKSPNSIEIAALLYKKSLKKLNVNIKYLGFKIPNKFVVGYGLDCAQRYRNLKSIYFVNN